jgi:SP family general alpha glucoside:H+ symporter-like MFS transporter
MVTNVMMQQLNKRYPTDYVLAMRILWAPVGMMILFWAFIPESPWYLARRGEREKAIKSMERLYGGIDGFDIEEELGIIERTIEHEKRNLDNKPRFRHVFQGANLVCLLRK